VLLQSLHAVGERDLRIFPLQLPLLTILHIAPLLLHLLTHLLPQTQRQPRNVPLGKWLMVHRQAADLVVVRELVSISSSISDAVLPDTEHLLTHVTEKKKHILWSVGLNEASGIRYQSTYLHTSLKNLDTEFTLADPPIP
jgi:hypothetical protein